MKFLDFFRDSLIISTDEKFETPKICTLEESLARNAQKRAVFFTVQGFHSNRRVMANLTKINAWAIDLDQGTKQEQIRLLDKAPILPSAVTETRRGHHAYWFAKNASPERFKEIMENLVFRFNADRNAKDICRVLRMPDCLHWKEEPPFMVKLIHFSKSVYSEEEMVYFFLRGNKISVTPKKHFSQNDKLEPVTGTRTINYKSGTGFDFQSINNREMLARLSGSSYISGDTIEFKRNHDGSEQIWVNGKSTACWIDKFGLIGSHDGGGPGIFQWLNWYYRDRKITMQVLRGLHVFN